MGTAQPPPNLRYLSVADLIASAGGSPWEVNASLQRGEPDQVAELGQAFHDAGLCTGQASEDFQAARLRFLASWDRETGEHPIDDSAEVRHAAGRMGVQLSQLADVGTELEELAAALAETQRLTNPQVGGLNAVLMGLDASLGIALSNRSARGVVDRLRESARTATKQTLDSVTALRDGYSATLTTAMTHMRALDGYSPDVLQGVDGDGGVAEADQARLATDRYADTQRAADQALVDAGGPLTPAKQDAMNRLRDYVTSTNEAAPAEARRLAAERLEDFNTVRQGQPSVTDPILGTSSYDRAQQRLEWQRRLEQGIPSMGIAGKSADQVTALLDDAEQQAKVLATQRTVKALEQQGMSPAGALAAVDHLSQGMTWEELATFTNKASGGLGDGLEQATRAESFGRHVLEASNPADVEVLERLGKRLGAVGYVLDAGLALNAIENGAPVGETLAKTGGGIGGGMLGGFGLGVLGGSYLGPGGALVLGVVGSIGGGIAGEEGVEKVYQWATG